MSKRFGAAITLLLVGTIALAFIAFVSPEVSGSMVSAIDGPIGTVFLFTVVIVIVIFLLTIIQRSR